MILADFSVNATFPQETMRELAPQPESATGLAPLNVGMLCVAVLGAIILLSVNTIGLFFCRTYFRTKARNVGPRISLSLNPHPHIGRSRFQQRSASISSCPEDSVINVSVCNELQDHWDRPKSSMLVLPQRRRKPNQTNKTLTSASASDSSNTDTSKMQVKKHKKEDSQRNKGVDFSSPRNLRGGTYLTMSSFI